jgi:hypothetical protein
MAWPHLKAATESTLYDGHGSYKNIMYRICSLVRKDGQQHAGWYTAGENYIAETTGFSLRQVQRAVAQFKKDGVFAIRTYRKGGKEFNHYRPNEALFNSRKRNPEGPSWYRKLYRTTLRRMAKRAPARMAYGHTTPCRQPPDRLAV